MAAPMEEVMWTGKKTCIVEKLKVKSGSHIAVGSLLVTCKVLDILSESEPLKSTRIERLKSSLVGTVDCLYVKIGQTVQPGDLVMTVAPCNHPTVMKDMCADCGADLRVAQGRPGERTQHAAASVAMVHNIPELHVSKEVALELAQHDVKSLLRNRKLVLIVDLDQTIIHTTMKNVHKSLPSVHHFQLVASGKQFPWYHTKIRPGCREFLEKLTEKFQLHIFTMGSRPYAHTVARILDPDKKLFADRILSRDECFNQNSKTANLSSIFPTGDHMVCIIDDREDVWNFAPNLIHVKPYQYFVDTDDINMPPGVVPPDNPLTLLSSETGEKHGDPESLDRLDGTDQSKDTNTDSTKGESGKQHLSGEEAAVDKMEEEPATNMDDLSEESIRVNKKRKVENDVLLGEKKEIGTEMNPHDEETVDNEQTSMETVGVIEGDGTDTVGPSDDRTNEDNARALREQGMDSTGPPDSGNTQPDSKPGQSSSGSSQAGLCTSGEGDSKSKPMDGTPTKAKTRDGDQVQPKTIDDTVTKAGTEGDQVQVPGENTILDTTEMAGASVDGSSGDVTSAANGTHLSKDRDPVSQETQVIKGGEDKLESSNKAGDKLSDQSQSKLGQELVNARVEPFGDRTDENQNNSLRRASEASESKDADLESPRKEDCTDDYLLYLEDILFRVHDKFFKVLDHFVVKKKDAIPDVKVIIPSIRQKVLAGVRLTFSSVFPRNLPPERYRLWNVAISLGAQVSKDFVKNDKSESKDLWTTHVVAAKTGTSKVNTAKKSRKVHVVTPLWLVACWERWERVDERLYVLTKSSGVQIASGRSTPASENEQIPPNKAGLSTKKQLTVPGKVKPKKEGESAEDDGGASSDDSSQMPLSMCEDYNPLYSFSSQDIKAMDKEVEDIFGESSSSDGDDESDRVVVEEETSVHSPSDQSLGSITQELPSSSDESLTAESPRGWKRKREEASSESGEDGESNQPSGDDWLSDDERDEMACAIDDLLTYSTTARSVSTHLSMPKL